MTQMEIKYTQIDEIKPHKHNPRDHPPAQIEALKVIIESIGFRVPVLIDAENVLIAGHGRYQAARELGLESLPAIRMDDLTPGQIRAFRLADNKLAELSQWNFDTMALEYSPDEILSMSTEIGLTDQDVADFMAAAHAPVTDADLDAAAGGDFEAEMNQSVTPKMPIVPQYCENYEAFVIVCKNSIDEAFMRQALGLNDLARSYADVKVRRPNILTVEDFKEKWESRS